MLALDTSAQDFWFLICGTGLNAKIYKNLNRSQEFQVLYK